MNLIASGENTGFQRDVYGTLTFLKSLDHVSSVKKGDIVFIPNGTYRGDSLLPTYRVIKAKAVGIVREGGGRTDHGSVAAKELGVPCIRIDTDYERLRPYEGSSISLVGGNIYEGKVKLRKEELPVDYPETTHKVKVNLGFPEVLDMHPNLPDITDGIAFARLEFVLLNILENMHPMNYIKKHGIDVLATKIADSLRPVVHAYAQREKAVWFRTDDFSPAELIAMEGGETHERPEANPNSGWRGIRRSIDQPEMVVPQFKAIKTLVEEGYRNIGLFPPMITHASEYKSWLRIAQKTGLEGISYGLMVETPRSAYTITDFFDMIEFVVFGTNDLTQFLLSIDRSNPRLSKRFDETDPVIVSVIRGVIKKCLKRGIETSIGGQAGSNEKLLELVLDSGLSGTSVNPDPFNVYNISKFFERVEKNR